MLDKPYRGPLPPMSTLKLAREGRLDVGGIREVIEDLRGLSPDDLDRIVAEVRAQQGEELALLDGSSASKAGKRAKMAMQWSLVTIIAAMISGPVNEVENAIMGWTPPSVTVVRQMSPAQVDELAHQILRQLQQQERQDQQPRKP